MTRPDKFFGILFSVLLLSMLAMPGVRWVFLQKPDGSLYGYSAEISPSPIDIRKAFFDKSLQRWVEKYSEVNLGFRAVLIRSFNELNFRLFKEAPRLRLYTTAEHGLYSKMSIDSLNDEIVRYDELDLRYRVESKKLLQVQKLLASQGKHFEVVIAASKPYVYPQGLGTRYLVGGSTKIFDRAISFGNALREVGVNVIDGGPLLREVVARTGLETHPSSGVHWNYYAGCLVAQGLFEHIRDRQFVETPKFDCGTPRVAMPHMVDIDGLLLLNIWSDGGIAKPSIYPSITTVDKSSWRPKIVFIGDSFSDQIRYSLRQANAYSRMVTSGYFRVREVDDPITGVQTVADVRSDESTIHKALLKDIIDSDVIVLQMVDYNIGRWGYGFSDYILKYFSG